MEEYYLIKLVSALVIITLFSILISMFEIRIPLKSEWEG